MRYVPWRDILKLGAFVDTSKFREYIQDVIDLETIIVNMRSIFIHLLGFQLLLRLSQLIEITSFDCTNRINLLCLKLTSGRIVISVQGFLRLTNLLILIKQKSPTLPTNLALQTFGKLLIVFLTKVNLLYLHAMVLNCFLLH